MERHLPWAPCPFSQKLLYIMLVSRAVAEATVIGSEGYLDDSALVIPRVGRDSVCRGVVWVKSMVRCTGVLLALLQALWLPTRPSLLLLHHLQC